MATVTFDHATRLYPGGTRAAVDHLRTASVEEKMYPGAMHEIFNETNRDEVIADTIAFINDHVG